DAFTVGHTFGEHAVVAAPGRMDAPHVAAAMAESGGAGHHQQRRVERGPSPAVFTYVRADGERCALRTAFSQVAPGQVEQFGGPRRYREREDEAVEGVRAGAGVADGGPLAEQTGRGELDSQVQVELRGVIGRGDDEAM